MAGGYVEVRGVRLMGAGLHVHWSAIALTAVLLTKWIRQPQLAIEAVACYFGVILLHELGHALMARRLGYRTHAIHLSFMHGLCTYDAPDTRRDAALVAWGGVLAQVAVAIPALAASLVPGALASPATAIPIAAFGYFSLVIAALNLAPVRPLDGAKAWTLVPMLWRDHGGPTAWRRLRALPLAPLRRLQSRRAARKATDDLLRRLK